MIRKLSIIILAVTLTVPVLSKPAQARSDLENFLAAMAAIGIVAAISKPDRKKQAIVAPAVKPKHHAKPKHFKPHKHGYGRRVHKVSPSGRDHMFWPNQDRRAYHHHGAPHGKGHYARPHRH